ncbi:DUF4116 domain-containing protein [Rhabdochlamydiaceae symbiont of Dictyostelium giganteum]|uniref:DUF4116 domain-containing protein n=1 Tax=Rhabdochlamydiaceae symbiont of Dictyostelium giganteum TaxID=3342349 RepID=UPI00384C1B9F
MNSLFSIFSQSSTYCSKQYKPIPHFNTIEEGVQSVNQLLQKKILCHHDVTHLTEAYQKIDQLESEANIIPDQNSYTILLKLTQKIEAMRDMNQISAEEIITAHHLQKFKENFIVQRCTALLTSMTLTLEKIQAIATHLPFCDSPGVFNKDVKALIGSDYSADIQAILKTKKDQFYKYQKIEKRQARLQQLKIQDPSNYPPYLEKVLNGGFLYLYDYLMAMKNLPTQKERDAAVKKLSFSSFTQIILEFREAITLEMKKIIPSDSKNIVFLLGDADSEKSTIFYFLQNNQSIFSGNDYSLFACRNNIFGHYKKPLCTFFPNITVVDSNFVLVDFPRFTNTYGQVISLAIEITLRTVVEKYSPKMLLLTPITEVGVTQAKLLSEYVKKILGTLDHCILGLTKYSQDSDFIAIKNIEKKQKEASLPSQEELSLEKDIKDLSPLMQSSLIIQNIIHNKKTQLEMLQQARHSFSISTLSNIEETRKFSQALQVKEDHIKIQTEIQHLISFQDHTDQNNLNKLIEIIGLLAKVSFSPAYVTLASSDKDLIATLFKNSLEEIVRLKNNSTSSLNSAYSHEAIPQDQLLKNIKLFKQNILNSSLINAILSTSYPKIGEFFHLKEINPALVQKYDKKLITDCINDYIDVVIYHLLIIEKGIQEISKEQDQEIEHAYFSFRDYILTLLKGIPQDEDCIKREQAWILLKHEHQKRLEKKKARSPQWMEASLLIPYGIFNIFKEINLDQKNIENNSHELSQKIQKSKEAIQILKEIEHIVKRQDELIQVFASHPLSLDSISSLRESIENQIAQVKIAYGEEEWEERIVFLTDQLEAEFSSIRPGSSLGENILYALISKQVSWENLPPYFNEATFLALIYASITSQNNYQDTLCKLIPGWKASSYKDLHVSNLTSFFHISSVTKEEYTSLLNKEHKLFDKSNRSPTSRLLLGDAIYRLWKKFSLTNENEKLLSFNDAKDRANILDAVRKNAWILEYSKKWLHTNKEFILSAIEANEEAFRFAEDALKNNREFILAAVQKNGMALKYISDTLKNDEELVLIAINQNECALEHASGALRNSSKFMLTVMEKNGPALQYASEALKNDREFIMAVMKQRRSRNVYSGWALRYVSKTLKNDREVVLAAVKRDGSTLLHASEALKNDREIVLAAVNEDGCSLHYASEGLKNDREVALTALRKDEHAFEYVSNTLKNDREFIIAAMKKNGYTLRYVSEIFRSDREVVLAAIMQNEHTLQYANETLKNDREVALIAVRKNGCALQYVSNTLKNDREIVLIAVKQDGWALRCVGEGLKNDKEVISAANRQ